MFELTLLCVCSVSAFIWLALIFMPARWRMSERWEAAGNPYLPVSKLPSLSVIVPARNESTSLPQTLPSWLAQEYPESEIILIDDDSSDGTEDCARGIAEQYKHDVRILKGIPHRQVGLASYGRCSKVLVCLRVNGCCLRMLTFVIVPTLAWTCYKGNE